MQALPLSSAVSLSIALRFFRLVSQPILLLALLLPYATRVQATSTAPTTTTLTVPSAPVPAGQVAVLVASVSANGLPVTAGMVTFREGAVNIGTVILQADGTAMLRLPFPPGHYQITAEC